MTTILCRRAAYRSMSWVMPLERCWEFWGIYCKEINEFFKRDMAIKRCIRHSLNKRLILILVDKTAFYWSLHEPENANNEKCCNGPKHYLLSKCRWTIYISTSVTTIKLYIDIPFSTHWLLKMHGKYINLKFY